MRASWEWRASFEPPPKQRERLERFVREEIIEAGFAGLRRALTRAGPAAHGESAPRRAASTGAAIEGVEIALTRYGGPEVLVPRRASIRAPGAGEVRLSQTAVGVNFIDVYCRRGSFDLVPARRRPRHGGGRRRRKRRPRRRKRPPGRPGRLRLRAARRLCFVRTMRADLLVRLPGSHQRRDRRCAAAQGH